MSTRDERQELRRARDAEAKERYEHLLSTTGGGLFVVVMVLAMVAGLIWSIFT